ncbi:MAG: hypothetical protein WKF36_01995 [Candidatus Nitrosocosmicus sp.]
MKYQVTIAFLKCCAGWTGIHLKITNTIPISIITVANITKPICCLTRLGIYYYTISVLKGKAFWTYIASELIRPLDSKEAAQINWNKNESTIKG